MPRRRTTSLDVWCRVQKPLLALTTDLQTSDLLRIVLPRSAYGDIISYNNYDHVVSTEGVQLLLDVALPMHCLDTDAPPRCQPRACRHVPVSTSRVMLRTQEDIRVCSNGLDCTLICNPNSIHHLSTSHDSDIESLGVVGTLQVRHRVNEHLRKRRLGIQ